MSRNHHCEQLSCQPRVTAVLDEILRTLGPSSKLLSMSMTPLRGVLTELSSVGSIEYSSRAGCSHSHSSRLKISKSDVRKVTNAIYDSTGLCLSCVKGKDEESENCMHDEDKAFAGPLSTPGGS